MTIKKPNPRKPKKPKNRKKMKKKLSKNIDTRRSNRQTE